ncbi:MAG: helix-turn-helix domain-containing protein [Eubacterium sp.]|nr:helix-turn-helix domain-containing protein [Eubacterium sp.]
MKDRTDSEEFVSAEKKTSVTQKNRKAGWEAALKELKRITGITFFTDVQPEEATQEMVDHLRSLINAYKEKNSRDDVMKRWILGRISEEEFIDLAPKCHIPLKEKRILYLVSVREDLLDGILDILQKMFPHYPDFRMIRIRSSQIVLIQTVSRTDMMPQKEACMLYDLLTSETMTPVKLAYSRISENAGDLPQLYRKACFCMEVGETFFRNKDVYGYDDLGLGRLLYAVPEEHCEDYLAEVLKDEAFLQKTSSVFQEDMLHTVNCFLDNNLNIAETARQLYVHRNTLLYRIDQIQRETGLDIRQFHDAMKYKLISMILLKKAGNI